MNRKSAIAAHRKSVKPRESGAPGSAGVPLSARRGGANRTILETTRSSVGGSRIALSSQTKSKDSRCFNEDFIQLTFRRLRDFLTQRQLLSDMPTSPKLTSRQFETLFLILVRSIDSNYNPPSGNNWPEHEVPIVMETLGYPQKIMKSTLQTISSKVGPVMGIIDFLIDLAAGLNCDHQEAIRLMSRDESPQQVDLQIELLTQSTFAKGVTVDSPIIRSLITDYCARTKGVVNEKEIRQGIERVRACKEESEAHLHVIENQELELKNVRDECAEHVQYIERMEHRMQKKKEELQEIEQLITTTRSQCADLNQRVVDTRKVIEVQPMSQNDIRRIRAESKDFMEQITATQQKIQFADAQLKTLHGSIRVQQDTIESSCAEILTNLVKVNITEKEKLIQFLNSAQKSQEFLAKLIAEQETLNKLMVKVPSKVELQLFEVNQKKCQLKTAVEFATQDLEALDEKISYFEARSTKKEAELLSKRQALKNCDNMIAFADREIEDLKVQLKATQDQVELAYDKFERKRFQQLKAEALTRLYEDRIGRVIQCDRQRMEKLVQFYQTQHQALPIEKLTEATIEALDQPDIKTFIGQCEKAIGIWRAVK